MKWRNHLLMTGTAQKVLWAFVILCFESTLTAIPTIAILPEAQSTGIPLEGIILESPDAIPSFFDKDVLDEILTAGSRKTVWSSGLFGEDHAVVAPWFSPISRYDFDCVTRPTTPTTWSLANRRLASDLLWLEATPLGRN